jgi:transcriptional regulator with XRE-family HTH domain
VIKTIFERIKRLAAEMGISVSKLEKECGLGNATVRGWATSDPSVSKLKIVADFLGVTIDDLVKEE